MRKLEAKTVLVLAKATCREHQLSAGFRPNLWGTSTVGPGEGPWGLAPGGRGSRGKEGSRGCGTCWDT